MTNGMATAAPLVADEVYDIDIEIDAIAWQWAPGHVLRLALSGAMQERLVPMPVRSGFAYKKKIARREYVRVTLRKAADGALEAVKFPREGAGMLSSLVDTSGLVELGEDITRVEPGQMVGFLSYAGLIN